MKSLLIAAFALATAAAPSLANDTMSQLGIGGLVFITTTDVSMDSENLSVGPGQVKVVYQFTNNAKEDQTALVAFPLPDITGDGDFMVSIPTEDPTNIFGFETSFDGKPVESTLHQYAFAVGVDQTDVLKSLDVPLAPFGEATLKALNALTPEQQRDLVHLGMVIPMTYDAGNGEQTDYTPIWTLRSTYTWEATFKAGETAEVVHTYRPSVGGTVATTFLAPPYDASDVDQRKVYKDRYCVDDGLIKTLTKQLRDPKDLYSAPFTESWISYVWSTGANWGGPIGKFHLSVDKGDPRNLVSFCWDGKVTKTGPTTFEMDANDWYPPYGHELEILILNHQDPQPDNLG